MSRQSGRERDFKIWLDEYRHLFSLEKAVLLRQIIATKTSKDDEGNKVDGLIIQVPQVGRNGIEGLPLKGGIGFLSFEETWANDKRTEYAYRFISSQYRCTTTFHGGQEDEKVFGFHYDDHPKHDAHLSLHMHSGIRYKSSKLEPKDFLHFIEEHFALMMESGGASPMLWHQRLATT